MKRAFSMYYQIPFIKKSKIPMSFLFEALLLRTRLFSFFLFFFFKHITETLFSIVHTTNYLPLSSFFLSFSTKPQLK